MDVDAAYCDQFASGTPASTDPVCADGGGALATNADLHFTTKLNITLASYNFSQVVTTSSGDGFLAPSPGHPSFVGATHPALGDLNGRLVSTASLGLTNLACNANIDTSFKFINSTVNNAAGNVWLPLPVSVAGSQGTLENMLSDAGNALTADNDTDFPPGSDGSNNDLDGSTDEADETLPSNGLPAAVERYPSYLNSIFDPDFISYGADGIPDGTFNDTDSDVNGSDPPVQPIARYRGGAVVSGSAVELDLVIFEPGDLAAAFDAPHPFHDLVSELGYTTVTVLQNPTATAAPSAITDFCADLDTLTTVFGEARANPCNGSVAPPCNTAGGINDPTVPAGGNGRDRARTPSVAGTYINHGYGQSLRDADGDDYENGLDTCPLTDNVQNPKLTDGPDGDAIDSSCDPTPGSDTGSDNHDGDTASNNAQWQNAGDNCPINSNGNQLDSELNLSYYNSFATNPAPQGGPKTDAIGDVCDPDDVTADGVYLSSITITAKCFGCTDGDDDGYCTTGLHADPNDASASVVPEDFDLVVPFGTNHASAGATPLGRMPLQVCNDGLDNDSDGLTDGADQGNGTVAQNASTCRPGTQPPTGGGNANGSLVAHPDVACPAAGCTEDGDGDGVTDEAERHIGTNPLGRCGTGGIITDPPSNAWPLDFVHAGTPASTDLITITDLTSYLAPDRRLDTKPGDPNFNIRWDLVPGPSFSANWIEITDLTALFAGPSGFPPMTSQVKVFGGVTPCTDHPVMGN
jgi:hypothetical protein